MPRDHIMKTGATDKIFEQTYRGNIERWYQASLKLKKETLTLPSLPTPESTAAFDDQCYMLERKRCCQVHPDQLTHSLN